MRTLDSTQTDLKNEKIGNYLYFYFKCEFATGDIYMSDFAFSEPVGSNTTKGWIKSITPISDEIIDELGLLKTSSFSAQILNDETDDQNIEYLLWSSTNTPETTTCTLYAYFVGGDPIIIWTGNIIDFKKIDDITYNVQFADESIKINKDIGTVIDSETYPDASQKDIGKIKNILYGPYTKVPCLAMVSGTHTSIKGDITASATTIYVTDGDQIEDDTTYVIDQENVLVTNISGDTLSVTRGYNSTTAVEHYNNTIIRKRVDPIILSVASHPVFSIDKVYAENLGEEIDITDNVNVYTGQAGDGYSSYQGEAIITVEPEVLVQRLSESINDSISIDNSPVSVNDNIVMYLQPTSCDCCAGGAGQQIQTGTSTQTSTSLPYTVQGGNVPPAQQNNYTFTWSNPGGTHTDVSITYTYSLVSVTGIIHKPGTYTRLLIDGTEVARFEYAAGSNSGKHTDKFNGTITKTYGSSFQTSKTVQTNMQLIGTDVGNAHWATWRITSAIQKTTKTTTASYTSGDCYCECPLPTLTRTGSAYQSGSPLKTGTIKFSQDVDAENVTVTASGRGYIDSIGNILERPNDIIEHFLETYGSYSSFTDSTGTNMVDNNYSFAVVINQRKTLKQWLSYMCWQCRCYGRFKSGSFELIWRPDTFTSDKTIDDTMIAIERDQRTTMRIGRSFLDRVINKIDLRYYKKWSSTTLDNSYLKTVSVSDSASIAKYGENARDLFDFDFIYNETMAANLANFYLTRYKDRKKEITLELFFNNIELEFADMITFDSSDTLIDELECEIQSVGIRIETGNVADKLEMRLLEY